MKRRKLLITGAAFILLVQTGLTSLASEQNVFPAKNMQAGIGKYYCGNHVQKHVGRHLCAAVDGSVVCGLGIHHGVTVYTDGNNTGNCHFENGYCTSWADTDGDGYCDACRNPVFREPVQQVRGRAVPGMAAVIMIPAGVTAQCHMVLAVVPAIMGEDIIDKGYRKKRRHLRKAAAFSQYASMYV